MRPILILLAAAAAFLVPPSHGWAQEAPSVVIAPPFVKGALPDAIAASIANELEQAFTRRGWRVVSLSDALQLTVPTPGPCNNNTCALAYADAAHVDAALQLSLFSHASVTFSLALVQPPGDAFVHHDTLADPYHPAPVLISASDDLLAQQARGPGPWLIVKGSPLDAAVRLDGEVIGVLPLRKRISGGEHVLVVSAGGLADYNDTIWIDSAAGSVKEVQVDLKPAAQSQPTSGADDGLRLHWAHWAGAAALVVGSVYLVTGIVHATQSGECIDRAEGKCVRYAEPGSRATMQIAIGAPLTALGVAFVVGGTIAQRRMRLTPSLTPTEARINLHTEF